MHFGIVGAGPIGTVFAACLKQAGQEVSILDVDVEKMDHYKKNPLVLKGCLEAKAEIKSIHTKPDTFVKTEPDWFLICTKTCDSLQALRGLKECGPKKDAIFVSCQNGIGTEEQIWEVFGEDRALRMVLNFGCGHSGTCEVNVVWNFEHFLSKHERDAEISDRFCEALNQAGIQTKIVDDYRLEAFKKGVLNSALGVPCALTGQTMKAAMSNPHCVEVVRGVVREGIAIAQAMGFPIGSDYLETAMGYLSKGGAHKPSTLLDIENARETEIEYLCGQLYRLAKENDVAVPVIHTLYALTKNLEQTRIGNKGK